MSQRIDTFLNDFKDRCDAMEIPDDRTAVMALTVLCEFIVALSQLPGVSATEKEFITMCRWHFTQLKEKVHG